MIRKIKKWLWSHEMLYVIVVQIINLFGFNSRITGCHSTVLLNHTRVIDKGNGNTIVVGRKSVIKHSTIRFLGSNNQVIIGDNCHINNLSVWIEDDSNIVRIGKQTRIHGATNLSCIEGCKIDIGEDCMFSNNINFRTGDSHSVVDLSGTRINSSKDIRVGNHVWIGQGVYIGKGVQIFDNSIVGAYSVVTKQFARSHVAIGGNPARIIRENVDWERERI